jgi:hypothetical protein
MPSGHPGNYTTLTDVTPMTALTIAMRHGIAAVRDDLFQAFKARFIAQVFAGVQEAVYASPPKGGAQTAVAIVALRLGKRATNFVAARTRPHPCTLEAARLREPMTWRALKMRPGFISKPVNPCCLISALRRTPPSISALV